MPEPFGACLVLAAAAWWLCRKPFRRAEAAILPETSGADVGADSYAQAVVISADTPRQ